MAHAHEDWASSLWGPNWREEWRWSWSQKEWVRRADDPESDVEPAPADDEADEEPPAEPPVRTNSPPDEESPAEPRAVPRTFYTSMSTIHSNDARWRVGRVMVSTDRIVLVWEYHSPPKDIIPTVHCRNGVRARAHADSASSNSPADEEVSRLADEVARLCKRRRCDESDSSH
jgi:hypothetical protein